MPKRPFIKVALVLLVFAFVVASGQSGGVPKPPSDAPPAVVSAVAPFFPPIAMATRALGTVVVEVKVDEAGAVTSAEVVSGHLLLKVTCLRAARRWRFAPA